MPPGSSKLVLHEAMGVDANGKVSVQQHALLEWLWSSVQEGMADELTVSVTCEAANGVQTEHDITMPVRVLNVEDLKAAHLTGGLSGVHSLHGCALNPHNSCVMHFCCLRCTALKSTP